MSRLQQATQILEERLQDREQQLLTYQVKLQQLQGMLARREAEMRALPEPAALEGLQHQVGCRLAMIWHATESSMARRLLLDAPSLLERILRLLVLALQLAESKAQTAACDQQAQRLAGTVEELQEKLRQAPTQDAMLSSIESQSQLRQQVSGTVTLC